MLLILSGWEVWMVVEGRSGGVVSSEKCEEEVEEGGRREEVYIS